MIAKVISHEGYGTFWAGFSIFYLRNVVFGLTTVWATDYMIQKMEK